MNGKLATLFASLALSAYGQIASPEAVRTNGAVLQLFDGSTLHGKVAHIEAGKSVQWAHPAASAPIDLSVSNIAQIRFEQPASASQTERPSCRFRFLNGDEITGNLKSLDAENASVETWFAGDLHAARAALQSIEFSTRGFALIYEGPTGLEGWTTGRSPKSWQYKDGAFIANGADILGRDFKLTGSTVLEFDLAWGASFSLSLTTYTTSIDRFDYNASSYMYYLSPGSIALQRVQAGAGVALLGQMAIPSMLKKNHAHFEIRSSKEEASLSLFIDGSLIQRWHDPAGFVAKGGGIVFFSQVDGPSLRLTNMRLAEWDGRSDAERTTNAPANADLVYLANKDKVVGAVQQIKDGKLQINTARMTLNIPIERVTQLLLSNAPVALAANEPWRVRAHFSGGEKIAFNLNAATEENFGGESQNFGPVQFKQQAVRQLQFNLDHPPIALETNVGGDDELMEGDE